jgi:NhaP-type Na+/H+ or K+/H+ antiporter
MTWPGAWRWVAVDVLWAAVAGVAIGSFVGHLYRKAGSLLARSAPGGPRA